jgi:conjugal transfer mating pair stabilization protein TraG
VARLQTARSSTGATNSEFGQYGQSLNRLDQITRSVAESTGLSQSQVASIAFGATAHVGGNLGAVGGKLRASADKNYQASLSAQEQKVLGSLTSEQLSEFRQFGERVSQDKSFARSVASDARDATELAARLSSSSTRSARAEAGLSERVAYAERVSSVYERGETIAIDIVQDPHNLAMFTRYAEQYGGSSAAARVMMEAELGRQALRPTRVEASESNLPAAFDDMRRQHVDNTRAIPLTGDVDGHHRQAVTQVRDAPIAAPPVAPPALGRSKVRGEIEAGGRAIRGNVAGRERSFDNAAELTKAPDGTVSTGRSLVGRAWQQVVQDGKATFDDAKDTLDKFIKRK